MKQLALLLQTSSKKAHVKIMTIKFKKKIKKFIKKIMRSDAAASIAGWLCYVYLHLIALTTRWERRGVDKIYTYWKNNEGMILLAWHGRAFMLPTFWDGSKPLNALVSLHQDGRIIAKVLERYGFGTIGGSTNENAAGAALSLMNSLQKKDASICIIPDGPRGPRMNMCKSPIYYAQKTGKPIFIMNYSIANSIIINKAWDKMMLPLPFSKGICIVEGPFYISASKDKDKLEEDRIIIEQKMNEISDICDNAMGLTPVKPDTTGGHRKKEG